MQKPTKTFADYLVVAISPVLIMVLVGSLAFFLAQVFYREESVQGVRWVLFWFVLAIVLVSRIGIEQSKGHAAFYGVALALVTWAYLIYSHTAAFVSAVLLAITWWCAHRLTIDCTLIDEEEDASGEGVISGLWQELEKALQPPEAAQIARPTLPKLPAGMNLAKKSKPARAPGRWVVYFSLAALPLFGLGQLLLPADNPEFRRTGFEFLAVYLAAALSLLITTSFLGMRRYLRQRFVEMPTSIAFGWVRFGVLLAIGVLIVATVLPRPGSGNSTKKNLAYQVDHKKHEASEHALPFNPTGEGDGAASDHPNQQSHAASDSKKISSGGGTQSGQNSSGHSSSQNDQPAPGQGNGGSGGQSGSGGGQSGGGASSGGGSGSGGGGGSGNASPPGGNKTPPPGDQSPNGAESDSGNKPVKAEDDGKEPELRDGNGQPAAAQSQNSGPKKTPQQKPNPAQTEQKTLPQPEQKQPGTQEKQPVNWQRWLRILVIVALSGLFVWFVIRYRRIIAQAFRSLMAAIREFFRNLFNMFRRKKKAAVVEEPLPAAVLQPFATYENPFLTGKDKTWPAERIILYTYEAVRAWAKEQGIQIRPQETPREFCTRLSAGFPECGPELERFSVFYGYVAFAKELPEDLDLEPAHQLWQRMGDAVAVTASR